jgi:hypothetical protein
VAVLLPVLCFLLLWAAFARRDAGLRASFLAAALTWGVLVAALTEGLSLFGLLTRTALAVGWAAAALGAAVVALRARPAVRFAWSWPGWLAALFAAGAAVSLAVTLAVALAAPPNTHDSLTYHLARVAHWAQEGSVAFYPTHCPRQLHMPPWAEYAVTHLLLLAGGDRPANLVQWFSTLGTVLGVSLLAARLGGGPRGQAFAALFCATLPMGILQASSTQNDAVVAFWLVCLAYHVLRLHERPAWGNALGAGASLGLALLTKGTAYLFAAPFVAWAGAAWLLRQPARRAWAPLGLAGLLVLALNLPHWGRNWRLCGAPLGPGAENGGRFVYRNEVVSAATLASNLLRNLGLHLRLPSVRLSGAVERRLAALHRRLGLDPDDPRTTWAALPFRLTYDTPQEQERYARHEDHAANLPHLLLVGLSAAAGLWGGLRRPGRAALLAAAVLVAFLLFCLLLRWQPWHARLHLPLFALCAPLVARGLERWRPAAVAAAGFLLAWAGPFLVHNALRPVLGEGSVFRVPRRVQYFAARPDLLGPYFEATALLRDHSCRAVGWVGDEESCEYPFWALLSGARPGRCRVEAVDVSTPSAALAPGRAPFRPDALVAINQAPAAERSLDGRRYRQAFAAGLVQVYLPDAGAASASRP